MSNRFRIPSELPSDQTYFGSLRWLSNPMSTGARQLTAIDVTIVPGQSHDFHRHPDQEELIWIVAGQVEQWIDRERRILGVGDAVFIPADVVHGSFNSGNSDARLIVIFSPCVGDAGFQSVDVAGEAPWKDLRAA